MRVASLALAPLLIVIFPFVTVSRTVLVRNWLTVVAAFVQ
jgi:hypothetical protein